MKTKIDRIAVEISNLKKNFGSNTVLNGIDFNKYTFGTIHIEHNWQKYRSEIKQILENNNYLFLCENKCDDIYVKYPYNL